MAKPSIESCQANNSLYVTSIVETTDLVTLAEEILNEKLHFLCSEDKLSSSFKRGRVADANVRIVPLHYR